MKNTNLHKTLTLICFMLIACGFSNAQTIKNVGETTGYCTPYRPINRTYNYSIWEGIYLKSEIGTGGVIDKISFYKANWEDDKSAITNVTILMKQTTAEVMTTDTYNNSGYTTVFTGTIGNSMAEGWQTVVLNTPFTYNNSENLEIAVVHNNQPCTGQGPQWKYFTREDEKILSRSANSDVCLPSTLYATTGRPALQLSFSTTTGGGSGTTTTNPVASLLQGRYGLYMLDGSLGIGTAEPKARLDLGNKILSNTETSYIGMRTASTTNDSIPEVDDEEVYGDLTASEQPQERALFKAVHVVPSNRMVVNTSKNENNIVSGVYSLNSIVTPTPGSKVSGGSFFTKFSGTSVPAETEFVGIRAAISRDKWSSFARLNVSDKGMVAAIYGIDYVNKEKSYAGYFDGKGYFSDDVKIARKLFVTGEVEIAGDLNAKSNLNVSGDLFIKDGSLFNGVGKEAKLILGDQNHFIKSSYGKGVTIGTFHAPNALFIEQETGNIATTGGIMINGNSKITADGIIWAKEVVIATTFTIPDYVFADDYKLNSFEEIEEYYSKHKHLEGVPSAQEVKDKGLKLGEMDAILLKKIEELTIYMVEMNKEVKELKEENKELKAKLELK